MKGRLKGWLAAGLSVALSVEPGSHALAQSEAGQLPESSQVEQPESADQPQEMTIRGQRLFRHLREEIHEAEDHMYGLFNELNGDDMLDIHCKWHAELGTRIRQRNCEPVFVRVAREGQAEDFLSRVQGSNYANVNTPAAAVMGHYNPKLEARMKELVQESPEFFEAIMRHHELRQELRRRKRNFFSED